MSERDDCTCGWGGFHDDDNPRCAAYSEDRPTYTEAEVERILDDGIAVAEARADHFEAEYDDAVKRLAAAEAKVAAVEVVLREITDAGQDALVGGFPEVRARIRAALGVRYV